MINPNQPGQKAIFLPGAVGEKRLKEAIETMKGKGLEKGSTQE
jgi:hypothetical protein